MDRCVIGDRVQRRTKRKPLRDGRVHAPSYCTACASELFSAAVEIGELVAGKYRVERVLGRGGQGEVVQATNLMLGQSVAMKVLLPAMAADQVLVQRFLREARAAVQLKSEHVARVLDVGTLDTAVPYIVFEYLDGADLNAYPREGLTVGTIVDFALQAAEALAEAHAK